MSSEFTKEFENFETFALEHWSEYSQVDNAFMMLTSKLERTTRVHKSVDVVEKMTIGMKMFSTPNKNRAALQVLHTMVRR